MRLNVARTNIMLSVMETRRSSWRYILRRLLLLVKDSGWRPGSKTYAAACAWMIDSRIGLCCLGLAGDGSGSLLLVLVVLLQLLTQVFPD